MKNMNFGRLIRSARKIIPFLILSNLAFADLPDLPPDLTPWVSWVKARHPEWQCAKADNAYLCEWSGVAEYSINSKGADFKIKTEMLKEGSFELPGSSTLVPRGLTIKRLSGEEVSATVNSKDGLTTVSLPAGTFEITGKIVWSELPSEIPLPSSIGVVNTTLSTDLSNIQAERENSSVRLSQKRETTQSENYELTVFRRIQDGSPIEINSLLRFSISGSSRPLNLGKVIPTNSIPISVTSSLPFKLSEDGSLAVQLSTGYHEINITSVMPQPVNSIQSSAPAKGWPEQETWVWVPNNQLRSVQIDGANATQPEATQLPPEWKDGAAYIVTTGSNLTLTELRRGEETAPPNTITQEREFWVDFSGDGMTVSDKFSGQLNQSSRLDALQETLVGRAENNLGPKLITKNPETNNFGIEFREQNLEINTVSRINSISRLSAVGWDTTVDSYIGYINLPPSWKLLHISGATNVYGSWFNSWSLLDLFLVILIVVGTTKIFGKIPGILVGISLLINHGEFLSPRMLLIYLLILATWRLLTPQKGSIWWWLSRVLMYMTLSVWTLQVLAFIKLQFTQALFPQLQAGTRYRTFLQDLSTMVESSFFVWPGILIILGYTGWALLKVIKASGIWHRIVLLLIYGFFGSILLSAIGFLGFMNIQPQYYNNNNLAIPMSKGESSYGGSYATQRAPLAADYATEQDMTAPKKIELTPKALASGPALPEWRWIKHSFTVPTPITPNYEIKFCLLSPMATRTLCALRVVISLLLLMVIISKLSIKIPRSSNFAKIMTAFLLIGFPFRSSADYPSSEILTELEKKIEQKQCSTEPCASITEGKLELTAKNFKLFLTAFSHGRSRIIVPGPLNELKVSKVTSNGAEIFSVRRNPENFLEIRTESGKNLITVEGELKDQEAFSLNWKMLPLVVTISAPDWLTEGVSDSGVSQESIRFTRKSVEKTGSSTITTSSSTVLPSWSTVQRIIEIGDSISVTTNVDLLSENRTEIKLKIPLFEGEQITSGGITIEEGSAVVTLSPNVRSLTYRSTLPLTNRITLTAKSSQSISEEWLVKCSSLISCSYSGLSPISSVFENTKGWTWQPFPNEGVDIEVSSLDSLSGESATVDTISHDIKWGTGILEGNVKINLRATKQFSLTLTLPKGSNPQIMELNGVQSGNFASDGTVTFLINPGSQALNVSYTKPITISNKESVPELKLNIPVNNLNITVSPSSDRWIIWTGGGVFGPSVLFWSKLIIITVICILLYGTGLLPISKFGSVLLGIGLTTLPVAWIVFPLIWLVLLKLIEKNKELWNSFNQTFRTTLLVVLTIWSIGSFYTIVSEGLVLRPPMLIVGNQSNYSLLKWFFDHSISSLPQPWIISLPLWYWKAFALAWSIWLVMAILKWLKMVIETVK